MRDGVSVVASRAHQKLGLKVLDRWELDVERPENRDGEMWVPPIDEDTGKVVNMHFAG